MRHKNYPSSIVFSFIVSSPFFIRTMSFSCAKSDPVPSIPDIISRFVQIRTTSDRFKRHSHTVESLSLPSPSRFPRFFSSRRWYRFRTHYTRLHLGCSDRVNFLSDRARLTALIRRGKWRDDGVSRHSRLSRDTFYTLPCNYYSIYLDFYFYLPSCFYYYYFLTNKLIYARKIINKYYFMDIRFSGNFFSFFLLAVSSDICARRLTSRATVTIILFRLDSIMTFFPRFL